MTFAIPLEYQPEITTMQTLPFALRKGALSFAEAKAFQCTNGYFLNQKIQLPHFIVELQQAHMEESTWIEVNFNGPKLMLSYLLMGDVLWKNEEQMTGQLNAGNAQLYYEHNSTQAIFLEPNVYESMHISFDPDYLNDIESDCLEIKKILHVAKNVIPKAISAPSTKLTRKVQGIIDDIKLHDGSNSHYFLKAKINELIVLYMDAVVPEHLRYPLFANEEQKLFGLKEYILQNLDSPLNITDLAKKFGMSETDLRRKFKAKFAMTLYHFIFESRMHKAMEFVKNTSYPISQIGFMLGYEDVGNFSNAFRRFFDNSPSYYRCEPTENGE